MDGQIWRSRCSSRVNIFRKTLQHLCIHLSPSSCDAPTINSATISASSFDCTPKCRAPSVCLQPKSRRWQPMATLRQQFKLALQGNPCQKNTTRKLQNPSIIRVTGTHRKLHQRHTRRTHVPGQGGPKLFREEILRRKFARCANEWACVCVCPPQPDDNAKSTGRRI